MQGGQRKPAAEIAQGLLDIAGKALMARDPGAYLSCHALPLLIETESTRQRLETHAGVQTLFRSLCRFYQENSVTALVRQVVAAEYRGDRRIEATHVTHIMAGAVRVKDPFPVFSVLERGDAGWRAVQYSFAVTTQSRKGRALHPELLPRPEKTHVHDDRRTQQPT